MHTPNQGLIYTFEFSAVLIICSLYECSLPSVPFPPFPSLVPYQKQSVVFVTHTSPLLSKSVHSLPSSPPTVPCPLFLFSIMLPLPIFDYALTLSVLDVLMLLLQDCWKCNFMQ